MLQRIQRMPGAGTTIELVVLAILLADFVRIVVRLLAIDAALGWDEAVYADRARAWISPEIPLSAWSYIRPPLLPAIASIAVAIGGEEWQLRIIGLTAGLTLLLGCWWLARSIAGRAAGLAAVAVLIVSPTLQVESAALLTDVPAAALVIALAGLLWRELEVSERPGWGLLAVPLLAGAAFLMRYGTALILAPLLLVAVAIWWPKLRAVPVITAAAGAMGLVFLLGHLAWSVLQTGQPLGVMLGAQRVVSPDPAGATPLSDYLRYVRFVQAGRIGFAAMVAGVAAVPLALLALRRSPAWRRPFVGFLFLVVPGMVHGALLSFTVGHAEPRFFIVPMALFVVAGVSMVVLAARRLAVLPRVAMAGAFAVALLVAHPASADYSYQRWQAIAEYYRPPMVAGSALAEIAGPDCGIVGGGDPIVAWYSRCETNRLRHQPNGESPGRILHAGERWALVLEPLAEIDAGDPTIAQVIAHSTGAPIRIFDPETNREIAVAWRLSP